MKDKLQRELSNRHIQLIAIGGAIGTGLFLGAGQSIHLAGPSILLTYIIVGFVLFMFMRAMGELLLSNLGFKSFGDFAHHQIGSMAGFMVGWTYWLTWIISGMAEVTAVAKYVEFWYPAIPNWLTVAATILILVALNLFSAKLFGELEFWLSIIKVITILALIIVGIVMIVFAMKTDYGTASMTNIWKEGGFFPNGTSGFLMSFQMAIFSFIGIELIGITAAETKDPHKTIPQAINNVPFRILLFYIGSLAVIMSVVPWKQLDPADSPHVKMFGLVGIPFAAGIINFVVLTAAASSCNSGIFANSRTMFGLAGRKQGPAFLHKTNKHGVPCYAILVTCGLLSISVVLNAVFKDATKVFVQITTFSTVLNIMIWAIIMVAYLGYLKHDSKHHKESDYKMWGGKYMAYGILVFFAFIFVILLINSSTRYAVLFVPVWIGAMFLMYQKYKKESRKAEIETEKE
ncbi:amino acid permease [Staphylococcus saccharolyticus]|uniref:amino acid permease n=1 Tax=Staphylococcus saccharolyticus TaxID=33028 RepID=UPI00102DCE22|nr:amino acid permease [Staphylococcus saccharolyticus]MBL7573773.1 amino acid permease [Staphylococcus saccharolyticus]MBL7584439.1 amino acid permease [Staphylococcus saccharolyticus]MBL7639301.1 amino acid permease [Staphylococcus saccharolyticus]QRJ68624.1 amino acid permease [Staphylococcus saccharolyticus]TAA91941.1 gamma-aminobutyrate permease [Staphylococcus saccharolyticus]